MLLLIWQCNSYASNYLNTFRHKHFCFFLHSSLLEDNKPGHDLLAFKSGTAYMGNLKNMFTDKFRDKDPRAVFHKLHWEKRLSEVLSMKTEYFSKNNLNLINAKERAWKNRNTIEKCFASIFLACNFYAYHIFHMNVVTLVTSA